MRWITRFLHGDDGQNVVEYGVAAIGIGLALIVGASILTQAEVGYFGQLSRLLVR
ncbi:MAG TPA: Flp family type IVb pilin [Chloroflexota bacterium]|jgi:Flp pilus assembly pilin Flp